MTGPRVEIYLHSMPGIPAAGHRAKWQTKLDRLLKGYSPQHGSQRNIQGFLNRNRTALDAIRKRFAVDQFEHEVARTFCFQKIVNGRDVGVIQLANRDARAVLT
jgi:hypothetical protein